MPYPTLIGVTGYAQHGKDTVGRFLTREYGFIRYAFADQLKELALIVNPLISEQWNERGVLVRPLRELVETFGWDEAKTNPEVRRFLQYLGTGVRDVIGAASWVNALAEKVDREGNKLVVVTDVRFPNEADWIHERGGVLLRVHRQAEDGSPYDNGIGTEHPSEANVPYLPADHDLSAKDVPTLEHLVAVVMVHHSARVTAETASMA